MSAASEKFYRELLDDMAANPQAFDKVGGEQHGAVLG